MDTFQRGSLLLVGCVVFCAALAATVGEVVDRARADVGEVVGPGVLTGVGLACILLALGAHRR